MPLRPRRVATSIIAPNHPDYLTLTAIEQDIRKRIPQLEATIPEKILGAVEFVVDPVTTGRTQLAQLDKVEKTFVGLKVEHVLRALLDAPKGIQRDLRLAGREVDVKNSVGKSWSWMIPPETYRQCDPCLLAAIDEARREVWLGLFVARPEYLRVGVNRDAKRSILADSYKHILWLLHAESLPRDPWAGIDMARFLELRKMEGGSERAASFFKDHLRRPIPRSVIQALLFDQRDPMKRLRAGGGAKDILKHQNIALVSGLYYRPLLAQLGLPQVGNDEHIAIDAATPSELQLLRQIGEL